MSQIENNKLKERIAILEQSLVEDRQCFNAAMKMKEEQIEALKDHRAKMVDEIVDLKNKWQKERDAKQDLEQYVKGCSDMIVGEGLLAVKIKKLVDFYYKASQDLILAAELIEPGYKGDIHKLIHEKTMEAQGAGFYHPEHQSMTELLTQYNIDNIAKRIDWSKVK